MKDKSVIKLLEPILKILGISYYWFGLIEQIQNPNYTFKIMDFLSLIIFTIILLIDFIRNLITGSEKSESNYSITNLIKNLVSRIKKNKSKRNFLYQPTKLKLGTREITRKDFKKACVSGGFFAGLISSSVILLSYTNHHSGWIGYTNMDPQHFYHSTIIIIFLFLICLEAFLGFLCGNTAWPTIELAGKRNKNFLFPFLIFLAGFISIVLFKQLMARDALVLPNGYLESNGNVGGGPLGEPDFETLATGLTGGIAFLILVYSLLKSFKGNVPSKGNINLTKEMFKIASSSAIKGFYAWISVFVLYYLLIEKLSLISKGTPIYENKKWLFVFDFPHPERYLLILLLCFIYLFSILLSIRFFSNPKSNIRYGTTASGLIDIRL